MSLNDVTRRALLLSLCGALLTTAVAGADADTAAAVDRRAAVDRLATPLVEHGWCEGLVVGVIDEDGPRTFGYGRYSETNASVPGGDTIFEIGSMTKAFTGTLLADAVSRGEVALDDPLQKFLPASVTLNVTKSGKPITLAHLASHASGLPRMPTNFHPADGRNPYADYTARRLNAFLRDFEPSREPGAKYEYSNLGMGLLGHVLAAREKTSYEQLLRDRVLSPLGMNDTHVATDAKNRSRLAPGHNPDGEPLPNWDWDALVACGGIRSTADDVLKFLAANMDPASPIAADAKLARKPLAKAMPGNEVALGWHLARKGTLVWHNGQTSGYHSYCGFVPDKKVGVVVLSNTGTGLVDELGVKLVDQLLGKDVEPIKLRETADVSADSLDGLVGRYLLTPSLMALEVTREGEKLFCRATAQDRFRIYPASDTSFFYKVVDAQIEFKLDKPGRRAVALVLHQNGLKLPGIRADGTPATLPTTSPATRTAQK
jgi:CubicO group peptidase (beta-lactamase class C family)